MDAQGDTESPPGDPAAARPAAYPAVCPAARAAAYAGFCVLFTTLCGSKLLNPHIQPNQWTQSVDPTIDSKN